MRLHSRATRGRGNSGASSHYFSLDSAIRSGLIDHVLHGLERVGAGALIHAWPHDAASAGFDIGVRPVSGVRVHLVFRRWAAHVLRRHALVVVGMLLLVLLMMMLLLLLLLLLHSHFLHHLHFHLFADHLLLTNAKVLLL
ncbi:hypothetical protein EGW08_001970, partial [Elysia chlorotica]